MSKKVLGLCGSLRADSYNLKLLRHVLQHLKENGEYTVKEGAPLQLPLLNEDLEKAPLDASITKFRDSLKEADIVVIASPEYNGSFTPALKNAIDWGTRPPGNLWAGKVIVMAAASPGGFAGVRGLIQLRSVLSGIAAWVIPNQVMLGSSHEAFDEKGNLKVLTLKAQMEGMCKGLQDFFK